MISKAKKIIILITVGIVFGLTTIITIFYPRDGPFLARLLSFYLPISIASGILLVVFVVYLFIRRKNDRAKEERLTWMTAQLETRESNEVLDELRLAVMDYHPELRESICSVCALVLEEEANVVQCLRCEKVFHEEHFIDWLSENENCPHCKNLILPFD